MGTQTSEICSLKGTVASLQGQLAEMQAQIAARNTSVKPSVQATHGITPVSSRKEPVIMTARSRERSELERVLSPRRRELDERCKVFEDAWNSDPKHVHESASPSGRPSAPAAAPEPGVAQSQATPKAETEAVPAKATAPPPPVFAAPLPTAPNSVAPASTPLPPAPAPAPLPPAPVPPAPVPPAEPEVLVADDMDAWAADKGGLLEKVAQGVKSAGGYGVQGVAAGGGYAGQGRSVPVAPKAPTALPPAPSKREGDVPISDLLAEIDRLPVPDDSLAQSGAAADTTSCAPVGNSSTAEVCHSNLAELVKKLKSLPAEADAAVVLELLEAIECIPLTVDDLKETQLGIITQSYKDSADQRLRAIVKRLRRNWKDILRKSVS